MENKSSTEIMAEFLEKYPEMVHDPMLMKLCEKIREEGIQEGKLQILWR